MMMMMIGIGIGIELNGHQLDDSNKVKIIFKLSAYYYVVTFPFVIMQK